jgi:hypothetical protein
MAPQITPDTLPILVSFVVASMALLAAAVRGW